MGKLDGTKVLLNRDSREITGRLTQSGQAVKQGAFACVWVADECY
jgi:hypothetical protein